jgi:hypothetical protein
MSARTAVALAAAALVIAVTEIITGAGIGARIVTIGVLAGVTGVCFVLPLIGTAKGAHATPRGYVHGDDVPTAVIPRVRTEHAPPWEGEHITEPTAIMPAPVPEPEPEAYFIAAGTVSDGRVTSVRVAVLPPPVEAILGHRTVDEALESMFTRAMARQVRALTDGAS